VSNYASIAIRAQRTNLAALHIALGPAWVRREVARLFEWADDILSVHCMVLRDANVRVVAHAGGLCGQGREIGGQSVDRRNHHEEGKGGSRQRHQRALGLSITRHDPSPLANGTRIKVRQALEAKSVVLRSAGAPKTKRPTSLATTRPETDCRRWRAA